MQMHDQRLVTAILDRVDRDFKIDETLRVVAGKLDLAGAGPARTPGGNLRRQRLAGFGRKDGGQVGAVDLLAREIDQGAALGIRVEQVLFGVDHPDRAGRGFKQGFEPAFGCDQGAATRGEFGFEQSLVGSELVLAAFDPQEHFHLGDEFGETVRFAQVAVGAAVESARAVLAFGEHSRDHQDRNMRFGKAFTVLAAELEAVLLRHLHIGDDQIQIGLRVEGDGQGRNAVGRLQDATVVKIVLQCLGDDPEIFALIVNDENAWHGRVRRGVLFGWSPRN